MPTLPIRGLTRPTVLQGQSNGQLTPGILKATPGLAGGLTVELVEPAARGWRALTAAAQKAGHVLKLSGTGCAYRNYATQERIFRERYTTTNNGTSGRLWNGRYWYKKPGVAAAAVPGTSNHGWGLAVDLGEERDGDTGAESVDAGTVAWLIANAHLYGFSAELQSEPWHWRWYVGDAIPPAVLAYEKTQRPTPNPTEDDDVAPYSLWKFSDSSKVYAVAADTQSKRHVKSPAVLSIDRFVLGSGRFSTAVGVAPAGTPLYEWLASIPTID